MYEQGRREPDNETLTKFCRFFGVPSDYLLLDGAETPADRPSSGSSSRISGAGCSPRRG
mgnify:CR=1 FL=1